EPQQQGNSQKQRREHQELCPQNNQQFLDVLSHIAKAEGGAQNDKSQGSRDGGNIRYGIVNRSGDGNLEHYKKNPQNRPNNQRIRDNSDKDLSNIRALAVEDLQGNDSQNIV